MKETIYSVVSSYDTYKNVLESEDEGYGSFHLANCDLFRIPHLDTSNSAHICQSSIKFLSYLKGRDQWPYIEKGCKYLYYWIYDKVTNQNKSVENALTIFNEFLKKHEDFEESYKFDKYLRHFNNPMLDKLIRLFELYDGLKIIKRLQSPSDKCECAKNCANKYIPYLDECYAGNDNEFCDELENFKHAYDGAMKGETCSEDIPIILPPVKRHNIAALLSIPFAVILVFSFVFFIFYKFTPLGLQIHTVLNKKKSVHNYLEDETENFLHSTDKFNIYSQNNEYSIQYQSVEHS
ncbi:Plasmodium vivax Vir protein, putative [Plasmodium ovale]|uniref:Plasmodium vivax Vir protein, putative n=1 Tax=Plasmodium ovale TaxID=36330 RepID=A0A1C3KJ28_PLAOA|nr:Plasmodium vivax Vir protein, putative [Plasmodium ovale]